MASPRPQKSKPPPPDYPSSEDRRTRFKRVEPTAKDSREPFQRDRDRILYSSAFRRLVGVTQVVSVEEGDQYHNRLTHSLKVAQVARRLAERLQSDAASSGTAAQVDLNADVAEAAGLAHDLGHPPFGHVGENALAEAAKKVTDGEESFEGNAQSFRVLVSLARRYYDFPGLNLTRATLSSVIKYPWGYAKGDAKRSKKWGCYAVDAEVFEWARQGLPAGVRSVEADIMDFADDISYSVHDLEDFIRVGSIPVGMMDGSGYLVREVVPKIVSLPGIAKKLDAARTAELLRRALSSLPAALTNTLYRGDDAQRAALRLFTSKLISRYVAGVSLLSAPASGTFVQIDPEVAEEVLVLKQLTWLYAIQSPALAAQQIGHARIVEETFNVLFAEALKAKSFAFPVRFESRLPAVDKNGAARLVADCISSMSERELLAIHARLTGSDSGTFLNPIFR
jgi:dGTPase